jgi:hypothetical protein
MAAYQNGDRWNDRRRFRVPNPIRSSDKSIHRSLSFVEVRLMAMKLSVGLQKKIGLPRYGSLGASCHVEFEVEGALRDLGSVEFRRRVRRAFVACRRRVEEELSASDPARNVLSGPANTTESVGVAAASHSSRIGNGGNRASLATNGTEPRATTRQVLALRSLAGSRAVDLAALLEQRFGASKPEELAQRDAGALICELDRMPPRSPVGQEH